MGVPCDEYVRAAPSSPPGCWSPNMFSANRGLAILSLMSTGCGASFVAGPPAGTIEEFSARMESMRASAQIPGLSVLIVKDQQVVFANGYGVTDVAKQTPVTSTTAFHLASLTKPFAATVI